MALAQILNTAAQVPPPYWIVGIGGILVLYVVLVALYRISPLHPLWGIPGPFLNRLSSLSLVAHSYKGDEAQYVHKLHQRYGPIVRLAHDSVDFTQVSALEGIYLRKGGFVKSRYYHNFDIDGHASIFSNPDLTTRGARAKAVLPLFSIASVKAGEKPFKDSIGRYLRLFKEKKKTGRVNALELARGMSIDAVTEYLFGIRYGAFKDDSKMETNLGNKGSEPRMSASAVVDSFILSSRFWYLSTWLYDIADRIDAVIYPNPSLSISEDIFNTYADRVIAAAESSDLQNPKFVNYPLRLLRAGFSRSETRAQCKDIIFAGTDTIGMNLSTLCFMLAKYPRVYDKLYEEVTSAEITKSEDIQHLPYLTNVVRETTRMSMTNPCRMPREVPAGGWTYQGRFYPAGMIVSCSPFEMHHSPDVFEEPFVFKPERWASPTEDMNKSMMPFGLGARQCIAKGMSLLELNQVTFDLVKEDILRGAKPVKDRIEILEGFSAKVIGSDIGLVWE